MTRFHVNPETGDAGPCTAKQSCPFGDASEHYDSFEEAVSAAERTLTDEYGGSIARAGKKKSTDPNVPDEYTKRFEALTQNDPRALRSEAFFEEHRREGKPISIDSAEFAAHSEFVGDKVAELTDSGMTTDQFFTLDKKNVLYRRSRRRQHREIVEKVMGSYSAVPREGKALISGGTGGAGKGYILETKEGVDDDRKDQYVPLNPDDIKEMMAEREMIPKVPGLTPMEASPLVHEEARHITNMIEERALEERRNVLHDMTAKSLNSTKARLEALNEAGYSEIRMVFVDVDIQTTTMNARERHLSGLEKMLVDGQGNGGRFLPESVNEQSVPPEGSRHNSKNAEIVQALAEMRYVDELTIWDNNRSPATGAQREHTRLKKPPVEIPYDEFKVRCSPSYQDSIFQQAKVGPRSFNQSAS